MTKARRDFLTAGFAHFLCFTPVGTAISQSVPQPQSESNKNPQSEKRPETFRDHLAWYGDVEEAEQLLGFRPKWFHCHHGWGKGGWSQALGNNPKWGQLAKKGAYLKAILELHPDVIHTCIMDVYAGPQGRKDPLGSDLDGILAGKYDDNFRQLIDFYVYFGQTKTIWRLWHEMDRIDDRFQAYASPSKFKDAFRYIVTLVRGMGNNSMEFQYSVDGFAAAGKRHVGVEVLELFYPGDEFVDRIGNGVYDRNKLVGGEWSLTSRLERVMQFADSRNKIFDIAEGGGWMRNDPRFPGGNGDNAEFVHWVVPKFMGIPKNRRGYFLWYNRLREVRIQEKPNQLAALLSYLR